MYDASDMKGGALANGNGFRLTSHKHKHNFLCFSKSESLSITKDGKKRALFVKEFSLSKGLLLVDGIWSIYGESRLSLNFFGNQLYFTTQNQSKSGTDLRRATSLP